MTSPSQTTTAPSNANGLAANPIKRYDYDIDNSGTSNAGTYPNTCNETDALQDSWTATLQKKNGMANNWRVMKVEIRTSNRNI